MRVGYARVSTGEQHLDLQLQALEQAGCELLFEDFGVSGMITSRPGLDKVISSISPEDVIVVWRLDRLGRSLVHLISLIEEFEKKGVGFISLTESIDTTTAGGRLVFHIMGALAEFERSLIVERTKAGIDAAKLSGKKIGRPAKLTAQKIAVAQREIAAGHETISSLATEYGVSPSTLWRSLKKLEISPQ